jgi:autotransporter-associated beta strand protein
LTVGLDNTNTTFGGKIVDGAGGLQLAKTGAGTLTLTGNNFYGGGTNLTAVSLG